MRSRWWLCILCLVLAYLRTQAQTTPLPVLQWQRSIETANLMADTPVKAINVSSGGYAVLTGTTLVRLSTTGDLVWTQAIPTTYSDSTAGYVAVQKTIALTPTPDDGVVVLAMDVLNRYYLAKLNANRQTTWLKTVERTDKSAQLTNSALVTTANGKLLLIGAFSDALSYLTLATVSTEGYITGQWRIRFSTANQAQTPVIRKAIQTTDGGYLLIGKATTKGTNSSQGLAIKLDSKYNLVWQNTYPVLDSLRDVMANPATDNRYTAVGSGATGVGLALTIAPNGSGDGTAAFTLPGGYAPVALVSDGTDNRIILDGTASNQRDFRLTSFTNESAIGWTKSFGGSGRDVPTSLLATNDGGYLVAGTTNSTDGDVTGRTGNTVATWVVKLGGSAVATTFRLLMPAYNCQTGAIVFRTTGGDGTPITYTAPGVTRVRLTDDFGTIEQELRNDPKPVTIQATQSGQTVSYVVDFGAYCQQLPVDSSATALRLLTPTYNCQTGAITFRISGGDGSPIEYAAAGITGWTNNPSQFVDTELRTAYDATPLTLMARQHGEVAMYVFDIKGACGRARVASQEENTTSLSVDLLGNPVRESVQVSISGAAGQSVQMRLIDSRGKVIDQRFIEQAGTAEKQSFDLHQQAPGLLLLHTTANGQTRTLKVIRDH
ncbi:hypothetical protein [Spirosoma sp. KUDC1026]|uniref:hypothetical protein n=1 Tax=Spirosoma sp. KUDC1026 TaxID=2745947 RepID=UPI00159BBA82|nr:hypothetical protein [Spirosoma sp. KUDC1026]QKZ13765.1 hypothetical protein HU175_14445 [Spirosoma sp. KUDC1026]